MSVKQNRKSLGRGKMLLPHITSKMAPPLFARLLTAPWFCHQSAFNHVVIRAVCYSVVLS